MKTLPKVRFGDHAKLIALPAERPRLQEFYRDVLACRIISRPSVDIIQLADDFFIGATYADDALQPTEAAKSTWLELRTPDPAGLKEEILRFGLEEIPYWDQEHFYFQAPGGQIFRLAGAEEDMSEWEN